MSQFEVEESPEFAEQFGELAAGLPRLDEHVRELKFRLQFDPSFAYEAEPNHYFATIETGTLDWTVWVEYIVDGFNVLLTRITVPPSPL